MNLSCDVVMDLVSIYHDGVASDATKIEIKQHLRTCKECRSYYRSYQESKPPQTRLISMGQADYISLAKKMRIRRLWTEILAVSYILASIAAVFLVFKHRKSI